MSTEEVPMQTPSRNGFRSMRPLWIAISLLALLNLCTVAYMWHRVNGPHPHGMQGPEHPGPPGPQGPPEGGRAFEYLVRELGMTEEQRGKYEDLMLQHRQAIRPVRDRIRELRRTLFEHLATKDEQTLRGQLQELAQNQVIMDSVTVAHFRQVRQLLDQHQQSTFDSVIGEVTRMLAAPPPPRPDRGPDDDGARRDDHDGRDGPPDMHRPRP